MKRKLIAFLTLVCIVISLCVPVFAAQESRIIQSVSIEQTDMTMICANPDENGGSFSVTLDGQSVTSDAGTLGEAGIPVTVFCLVDISGSIQDNKMVLLRDTLTKISDSMGQQDTMVIATVDNQLVIGEELKTREEREAAIAQLAASNKDTNLFGGIVSSINHLSSEQRYNPYRCLVVLSDGAECQDDGMTEQEVLSSIEKSRIPVYTVALLQGYEDREGGKIMGSFARASYGGVHQTTVDEGANRPVRSDVSGEAFGGTIWDSIQGMTVLTADISGIYNDGSSSQVSLTVDVVSGSSSYTETIQLDANQLPAPPAETEPTTEPTDSTTETTVPEEKPDDDGFPIWIILVAVAVIVIIVVLILVSVKKKKKPVEDIGGTEPMDEPPSEPPADDPYTPPAPPVPEPPVEEPPMDFHPEKQYRVSMTDIPYGTMDLEFTIPAYQAVTFGRDKRSQKVLNATDKQLSGLHFALVAQDGLYCIRDEGSSNGTYLNGVPIQGKGWMKIQSHDKIRVGGYEYRIIIELVK